MIDPIIFNSAHPLIIRPIKPFGFVLETIDGKIILSSPLNYRNVKFVIQPISIQDETVALTMEMEWIEMNKNERELFQRNIMVAIRLLTYAYEMDDAVFNIELAIKTLKQTINLVNFNNGPE